MYALTSLHLRSFYIISLVVSLASSLVFFVFVFKKKLLQHLNSWKTYSTGLSFRRLENRDHSLIVDWSYSSLHDSVLYVPLSLSMSLKSNLQKKPCKGKAVTNGSYLWCFVEKAGGSWWTAWLIVANGIKNSLILRFLTKIPKYRLKLDLALFISISHI